LPDDAAAVGDGAATAVEASSDARASAAAAITPPALSTLVGWASLPGLGVETTTGGGGAPAVLARSAAQLVALAASPDPLTIAIAGTIELQELSLASNKTLIGLDRGATLAGGIAIRGTADAFVANVIIANLNIAAETSSVDGDGIQVHYAHHVWVDHCALSDAADGLLDIVHGSDFVTVSHTRFFYTQAAPDPAHRFAALVGDDLANGEEDRGHLNVTWHHDFWGEGVSRAVSGRFGSLHLFNNLFRSPGGASVLSAGFESSWLVENNEFEDVAEPHTILVGSGASLAATGNVYLAAAGDRDATATGFVPAYPYALDSPFELAASIEAEAGPR
jgi:pectate lyase